MIERRPFYWLFFRLSDAVDAPWESGRMIITPDGQFWLMLKNEDVARLVPLALQTRLDQKLLLERHDDAFGGTYFVHQGPIQEMK